MAGIGRRFYELLRANLNDLLDRSARHERDREGSGTEKDGDGRRPPGWDRETAQHYANLELTYGATLPEVKKQYRRLMSRYHPDRHPDPEKQKVANRLAAEITRSYDALTERLEKKRP